MQALNGPLKLRVKTVLGQSVSGYFFSVETIVHLTLKTQFSKLWKSKKQTLSIQSSTDKNDFQFWMMKQSGNKWTNKMNAFHLYY